MLTNLTLPLLENTMSKNRNYSRLLACCKSYMYQTCLGSNYKMPKCLNRIHLRVMDLLWSMLNCFLTFIVGNLSAWLIKNKLLSMSELKRET